MVRRIHNGRRIALFSWESVHSVFVGGVAVHVSELARTLAEDGNEVHVFTRFGGPQPPDEMIDGVTYHRCAYPGSGNIVGDTDNMCGSFAHRLGEVEGQIGPFDVLHAHDWMTARALSWTRDGGHQRTVFTLHSTEFGRCGNYHCDGVSQAIRDREWGGAYDANCVLTVSKYLQDEVREIYHVPQDKMRVVHNGVNVQRFDIPVDVGATKEHYALGRMDPTVLFCGRLCWQKGPDILMEAIPPLLGYYPHAKFLIAGDGDMRPGLEARARELKVDRAIRFLGYRSGQELVELFKICDVVCVPSRNEPFGIVVLEAWAAEKPVVATRNGGPSEFVRHGIDGLSIYDNPDSVGWGLGTLFMDFERARWMGRNGREAAETRFDWRVIGRQVDRAYEG